MTMRASLFPKQRQGFTLLLLLLLIWYQISCLQTICRETHCWPTMPLQKGKTFDALMTLWSLQCVLLLLLLTLRRIILLRDTLKTLMLTYLAPGWLFSCTCISSLPLVNCCTGILIVKFTDLSLPLLLNIFRRPHYRCGIRRAKSRGAGSVAGPCRDTSSCRFPDLSIGKVIQVLLNLLGLSHRAWHWRRSLLGSRWEPGRWCDIFNKVFLNNGRVVWSMCGWDTFITTVWCKHTRVVRWRHKDRLRCPLEQDGHLWETVSLMHHSGWHTAVATASNSSSCYRGQRSWDTAAFVAIVCMISGYCASFLNISCGDQHRWRRWNCMLMSRPCSAVLVRVTLLENRRKGINFTACKESRQKGRW